MVTTIIWIIVTFLTKPESDQTLIKFYNKTNPGGPSWTYYFKSVCKQKEINYLTSKKWIVPSGILSVLLGCVLIYSILFTTGFWIYGDIKSALITTILIIISIYFLIKVWGNLKSDILKKK